MIQQSRAVGVKPTNGSKIYHRALPYKQVHAHVQAGSAACAKGTKSLPRDEAPTARGIGISLAVDSVCVCVFRATSILHHES